MLIDPDGHPVLGETGPGVPRATIAERIHAGRAETTVELSQRQLDTVDLIVQGATLRQVAERHGVSIAEAKIDYQAGMQALTDASIDRTKELRDEVTMRQRCLILANMSRARAGDVKAAAIVQRADALLVEMWGVRYIRPEMTEVPHDPGIQAALAVYLERVTQQVGHPVLGG